MLSPMPRLAPVTKATLSFRLNKFSTDMMFSLL
jgi:hypothetical protein